MDLVFYLRQWIKRPTAHSHSEATPEQPEAVRTLLRRPNAGKHLEREADRHAATLAPHLPTAGRSRPASADSPHGEPLPEAIRDRFEQHFGQDLSQVRIHTGHAAQRSASALGAKAYTLGRDIVFGPGRYAPHSPAGHRLLAHELTHVAQQNASATARTGARSQAVTPTQVGVQCEDGSPFQLRLPGLSQPWWEQPREPRLQLKLDPAIEAELALMRIRFAHRLLAPEAVRRSLLDIDPSTLFPSLPPNFMASPNQPQSAPAVPAGRGPATPRPATSGDLLRAIMAVPAVDSTLTRLRDDATRRIRSDWRRLSTGEQVLLVSHGILMGGTALAGILSNEQSRNFVLDQIQNRNLPVPGVPGLSFQFNATGPDRRLFFTLDLARLVSR